MSRTFKDTYLPFPLHRTTTRHLHTVQTSRSHPSHNTLPLTHTYKHLHTHQSIHNPPQIQHRPNIHIHAGLRTRISTHTYFPTVSDSCTHMHTHTHDFTYITLHTHTRALIRKCHRTHTLYHTGMCIHTYLHTVTVLRTLLHQNTHLLPVISKIQLHMDCLQYFDPSTFSVWNFLMTLVYEDLCSKIKTNTLSFSQRFITTLHMLWHRFLVF